MAKREARGWSFIFCGIMGIFLLVTPLPAVHAEPIDVTDCFSGTANFLMKSEELTIMAVDAKGIIRDNLENKIFDNITFHCVGLIKMMGGKRTNTELCKYMDPGGDLFIVEGHEGNAKFIHGTGKWKGIRVEFTAKRFTRGKPITPDTFQGCAKLFRPTPIIAFHGTADLVGIPMKDVETSVAWWAEHNGCNKNPTAKKISENVT